jgi:putative intracellular protease/amidase
LTFSANNKSNQDIARLLWLVKRVIKEEGFTVHPKKTHIMRKSNRQEVTGIVVNKKLSVNRKKLRNFKSLLYQIESSDFTNKHWNGVTAPDQLMNTVKGYADFLAMVMPQGKGKQLQEKTYALLKANAYHFYKQPKRKKWWKFW